MDAKYKIGDCFSYKGTGNDISWIGKIVDVWFENRFGEEYDRPIYVLYMLVASIKNQYYMTRNAWNEQSIEEDCVSYSQEQFTRIEESYHRMVNEVNQIINHK